MSKNIVFMHTIGYKPEYEVSKQSWSLWCDKNNVYYEPTDKRVDLIERIKQAGYK